MMGLTEGTVTASHEGIEPAGQRRSNEGIRRGTSLDRGYHY